MAEKKFDAQVNYGWGLSLNMTGKAPAVAKRIFNTLSDAQAYADDVKDSAIEGLVLSVVADGDKNGVYFVQSIKTEGSTNSAVLVKLGTEAGASGNLSAAIQALNVTDTAVAGQFVSEVSQTDGKISVKRASLADAKVDVDSEGHDVSLKVKLAALNQSVVDEKKAREQAFTDIKGTLGASDATTLEDINDELDAIDAKIGTVTTGKTVVGMIAEAETAAKAAATKMKLADNEELLTLSHTTDAAGAITYTLGTNNVASDAELQAEAERAKKAEKANADAIASEASTARQAEGALATRVTANETAINTLNGNATTKGSVAYAVAAEQRRAEGKESELATSIANESTARTAADTALANRLTVIEGEGEGSIKKAIADIKGTLGETDAKTLAALNDRIDTVSGAAKTYRIAQVVGDELTNLGANVKEAYKLVDEDGIQSGATINIYKDSSLQSVALVGQELQFTYILASGQTSTVSVDVSTFLAESEFANGLQVVNHIVSVKVDATSENFLTVGEGGVKLSGVQDAIDAAKKVATDRLDVIQGEVSVDGSIKKAVADAKTEIKGNLAVTDAQTLAELNDRIDDLTSTKTGDGTFVDVTVAQKNGVITAVTVNESDIAKASELDALEAIVGAGFTTGATVANKIAANKTAIETEVTNRTQAVADAKASIISGASSDYNTLGKLENKVKAVDAAAKAAATTITTKTDGHVKVSVSKNDSTSALTYTISESDIASAQELDALEAVVGTGFTSGSTVADHITVLEGVKVTGKDAIVVSSSDAKTNKKVSLKLGTQPSEKVGGVVLSQDTNGLVAKLYWGTF